MLLKWMLAQHDRPKQVDRPRGLLEMMLDEQRPTGLLGFMHDYEPEQPNEFAAADPAAEPWRGIAFTPPFAPSTDPLGLRPNSPIADGWWMSRHSNAALPMGLAVPPFGLSPMKPTAIDDGDPDLFALRTAASRATPADTGYPTGSSPRAFQLLAAPSPRSPVGSPLLSDVSDLKGARVGPNMDWRGLTQLIADGYGAPYSLGDNDPVATAEERSDYYLRKFRELGDHTAAADHERWRSGVGGTRHVSLDEMRSHGPGRDGEATLEKYYEKSFPARRAEASYLPWADTLSPDSKSFHGDKLVQLKDGESIPISDKWDVDYGFPSFIQQLFDPSARDFALAFGRAKLQSKGDFTATRRGDEIKIEGLVTHGMSDRYDFNPGQVFSDDARLLEKYRGARPFDRTARWPRRMTGTIRIKDGKLSDPRFTWEDVTWEGLEP